MTNEVAAARFIVGVADKLAAEVERLIEAGRLDARSEAGDALLSYDSTSSERDALGLEEREGKIGWG